MNLIPDPVLVLLQIAPFLVLMFGLDRILYRPFLAYLEERDHATSGTRKEADSLQHKAEERLAEWEAAMSRTRNEIASYRAARRAEAQADYARVIAEARAAADKKLSSAMTDLTATAEQAREGLKAHAEAIAMDMTSQVLGRAQKAEA